MGSLSLDFKSGRGREPVFGGFERSSRYKRRPTMLARWPASRLRCQNLNVTEPERAECRCCDTCARADNELPFANGNAARAHKRLRS